MPRENGDDATDIGGNDDEQGLEADSSREYLTGEPKPPPPPWSSQSSPSPLKRHLPVPLIVEGITTSAGPPLQDSNDVELGQLGQSLDAEDDNSQEERFFAVPGGPGIRRIQEEDGNDRHAFFHPATKEPQRILWLPRDELGLCEAEIEANASAGVDSTHRYAILNAKVRVIPHALNRLTRGQCRGKCGFLAHLRMICEL